MRDWELRVSSGHPSFPRKRKAPTGSHKTWGGWETRSCWRCAVRIVLARGHALHCFNGGRPFSLCGSCSGSYGEARAAMNGTDTIVVATISMTLIPEKSIRIDVSPKVHGEMNFRSRPTRSPHGLVARNPFDLGCRAGWITHGHPSGYLAAGYLAELISGLVHGLGLDVALAAADARLVELPDHAECLAAVQRAREFARQRTGTATRVAELGEGWVAEEALAIAIYCALVTDSFRDALLLAVNHSGDSDSTGAITGNILGAAGGIVVVPEDWLAELELRAEIDQLARDLHAFTVDGQAASEMNHDRYPPS